MKKIVGIILSAVIAAGAVPSFAEGAVFTDISDAKYSWAKPYIEEMAASGYIAGYEDNTYRPDNEVTRLETIVLFSRAMGARLDSNAEIVSEALRQYSDIIDNAKLNFGEEEVAFMLYRGALSEEDINTYLSDGKASAPMPRQEAAAIITKAMCGEETAKSELLTDMEYNDAKLIDSAYTQYVFYVSEMGIMNGMDDGSFSPASSVLRSQIAVMLYRAVDKMNLYVETVVVPNIDTEINNITILDEENSELKIGYEDYTMFYIGGELADETDFVNSSRAMLTYINNNLVYVDMYDRVVDEAYKGIFQGSTTEDGVTTVTIKPDKQIDAEIYDTVQAVEVFDADGKAVQFRNLAAGSYVEYEITNNKIIRIIQLKKDSFIEGAVVESISIEDDLYLTISHDDEEYDAMVFRLNDNVAVYKNDDLESLSKIYKGDRIDIYLEYGVVTKLKAASNVKNYEGTVSELSISSQPVLKVKVSGEIMEFEVLPDIAVKINNEDASLYDLRVGDTVKVTTESNAVLKIVTTAAASAGSTVEGEIEVVNSSKGFLKVNGETVFCKDSTTTIVTSAGAAKMMKDLSAGQTVSIRGTVQNGAYTATLIIIE